MPVSEVSAVQLKPGPSLTNLTLYTTDRVSVLGTRHHVESVGVVVLKPEFFGFMWWDGEAASRINGEPCRRNIIYPQGSQNGFHAVGGARRTMGMALRRKDLAECVAALRGVGPEDVKLDDRLLRLSTEQATRFRNAVRASLRTR